LQKTVDEMGKKLKYKASWCTVGISNSV
jgi:hypothetical protein